MMQPVPAPSREPRPPRRQQLQVRRRRDRRPASPVDRSWRPDAGAAHGNGAYDITVTRAS